MAVITIIKKDDHEWKDYFKATCSCGAKFAFSSDDISGQERRLNGTKWISCPECGKCIYWSNNHSSNEIETISEEEYNEIVKEFGKTEEVEEK